jgi:hypothetical protein
MKPIVLVCAVLAAGFNGGCSKTEKASALAPEAVHKHEHKPPHGGTPVELGEEEYHVELVLDASAGKLQAFIMDGELENFVRLPEDSFEIVARLPGKEEILTLKAVANNATGETVGDTALFEAQADWLKTTPAFNAVIKELAVRGNKYQSIVFSFPKGNETGEKEKK